MCFWTILCAFELKCVELRFIVCQKTTPTSNATTMNNIFDHLKKRNSYYFHKLQQFPTSFFNCFFRSCFSTGVMSAFSLIMLLQPILYIFFRVAFFSQFSSNFFQFSSIVLWNTIWNLKTLNTQNKLIDIYKIVLFLKFTNFFGFPVVLKISIYNFFQKVRFFWNYTKIKNL